MDEPVQPPIERPIIWVLEDSPLEAAMARRALTPAYDVEVFTDGSTLIERIAAAGTFVPTVLVLDLQLPGMSGIEVCKFLRSRYTESALPILMLTVYGHKSDLLEGLEAGANDYVTKPYDAAELVARVATLSRMKLLFDSVRRADEHQKELLAREQHARGEVAAVLEREREARREAEAANAAKDEFLAMVSHELRTPLNAILGWTRLLRADEVPADRRARALETIERNAIAQTHLIEDLLDMSRVLSGTFSIDAEPVEIVNVVNLAIDAVRPRAHTKKLAITQQIHPDGGRVLGDPNRLQQVIDNLLTNAIKFTPAGGNIKLTVDVRDDVVDIAVTDSGRGIDGAFLPFVFDRFRQAEGGRKRSQGGLGLGLAIVKRIVDLHGGSVLAESGGVGLGATFRVELPLANHGASKAHAPTHLPVTTSDAQELAGLNVIAVDDDMDALELLGTLLRRSGATVLQASSAKAALALLDSSKPDVIISDIGMPEQDGYELVRSVRARAPERGGATPAVALTAFAGAEDRARALAAGFTAYLAKPVEPLELILSIANVAGRNIRL